MASVIKSLAICGLILISTGTRAGPDSSRLETRGLALFLPDTANCPWAVAEDEPVVAQGSELFGIINGGAELYIKHGYKQALFQEYQAGSGKTINIEIFEMPSPEKADSLFGDKGGGKGNLLEIGDKAVLKEYYCMFRKGPYLVTITSSLSTGKNESILKQIAKHMSNKMRN
jgi:hypothetical protein